MKQIYNVIHNSLATAGIASLLGSDAVKWLGISVVYFLALSTLLSKLNKNITD